MDYFKIGQRIRKFRKAAGLSQEQLAEKVGISVTHMSHIETGNTKLSLQVFIDISKALDVPMDDLAWEKENDKKLSYAEIDSILEKCSSKEIKVIADIVKAAKVSMDKFFH